MRHVLMVAVLLTAKSSWAAGEFTTDAAKAAEAAYEADLKAARERYAAALDEAAKKAVEDGELDEVVRIKEVKESLSGKPVQPLSLAKAQRILENTRWSWASVKSGRKPSGISFLPDQEAKIDGKVIGAWQMVEPHIVVMRSRKAVHFIIFNDDYTAFTDTHAFIAHENTIKPGKRISPPRSTDITEKVAE